jgi:hypothetical protein
MATKKTMQRIGRWEIVCELADSAVIGQAMSCFFETSHGHELFRPSTTAFVHLAARTKESATG